MAPRNSMELKMPGTESFFDRTYLLALTDVLKATLKANQPHTSHYQKKVKEGRFLGAEQDSARYRYIHPTARRLRIQHRNIGTGCTLNLRIPTAVIVICVAMPIHHTRN